MEGFRRIILTPHQRADRPCVSPEGTRRRMEQLQEELDRRKIPLRLYPGSEIFFRHGAEELLSEGKLLTLADSRYCLTEFFPEEDYAYIRDGLSRLSSFGYLPILAHAERYEQVMEERRLQVLGEDCNLFPFPGAPLPVSVLAPILSHGDIVGSVALLGGEPGETETRLLGVAAAFLGRQMEE